jgi:hypothetical protein
MNRLLRVLLVAFLMLILSGNAVFAEGQALPFYRHLSGATYQIYLAYNETTALEKDGAVARIDDYLLKSIHS